MIKLQNIKRYIENADFSSYLYLYPPMALWKNIRIGKGLYSGWRKSLTKMPVVGLYIHIPFCKTKCLFCRYGSTEISNPKDISLFLKYLKQEIENYASIFRGYRFSSFYVGGGSPSILTEAQLDQFFKTIYKNFQFKPNSQVAFESNPDNLTLKKLLILKQYGVNRLTLGVQVVDQELTKMLNRAQTPQAIFSSYNMARKVGIPNINIDLMYGLPYQTVEIFKNDLETMLRLKPDMVHINKFMPTSFIGLGPYPKKYEIPIDKVRIIEIMAKERLAENGYHILEYDSWSLNPCAQNEQLTQSKRDSASFLGLGPGAVSRAFGYLQYVNYPKLQLYCNSLSQKLMPIYLSSKLTQQANVRSFILNNIWYGKIPKRNFKKLFGKTVESYFDGLLKDLLAKNVVIDTKDHYEIRSGSASQDLLDKLGFMFYERKYLKELNRMITS